MRPMNFCSLLKNDPSRSQQEIEDSFEGNVCRCTGYRSILAAMKSFGNDGSDPIMDIEVIAFIPFPVPKIMIRIKVTVGDIAYTTILSITHTMLYCVGGKAS